MAFGPIIGDAAAAFALISPTGQRSIGTLIPDVAVEEIHHDESEVTWHTVETGSPVSDHVFDNPNTVELRWFWGDSAAQAAGYSQVVYQELLSLKASHTVFNVSTGKRQYTNMLVRTLIVKTDPQAEFTLAVIAICQELIFASLQTTSGSTSPNTNGNTGLGNISNPGGPGGIGSDAVAGGASGDAATSSGSGGIGSDYIAAGGTYDSQGNVSFPNGVASSGSVSLNPNPTASSYGDITGFLVSGVNAP